MSMGKVCNCDERKKPIEKREWFIMQFRCNHSAFNGYHYTSSDWSAITCDSCHAYWRTVASYVDKLKMHPTYGR